MALIEGGTYTYGTQATTSSGTWITTWTTVPWDYQTPAVYVPFRLDIEPDRTLLSDGAPDMDA